MRREDLQAIGLNDEQVNAVMRQNGLDIENARSSAGGSEAAERARADRLQAQLDEITVALAAAQESASNAASLRKSFDELNAKHQATIKSNAIRDALAEFKPKDPALMLRLLDADKITLETDGKVNGLKEQVDALKTSSGYLFADTPDPQGGKTDPAPAGGTFDMNAFLRG